MIKVIQNVNTPKDLEVDLSSSHFYQQNETNVDNLTIPEEKTGTIRHRGAFPSPKNS